VSHGVPSAAMVLAAGLGKRLRPITDTIPKPLVEIGGRTLLDRGLDALDAAGVATAVVNVHHLAGAMRAHLAARAAPRIVISDETDRLLDSAGGIVHALPELGSDPFYILNADTFWLDGARDNLRALADMWDPARMDMLLLLVRLQDATGHSGGLDFVLEPDGRLRRAGKDPGGAIYAGAGILTPGLFEHADREPHSLNRYFDEAIAAGRLFGQVLDGHWITVGTPDAIGAAEEAISRHARRPA
jgi:MurNAc alpha-1-phosphate uridylyltransferase